MTTIPDLARIMQVILIDTSNELGRSSGFIRRQRKWSGASFVQTLVFGWMGRADASSSELRSAAVNVGVEISRQGVVQRFNWQAVALLEQVLKAALGYLLVGEAVEAGLLRRFAGVYIMDSTRIELPDSLAGYWSAGVRRAGLKVSVCWEMVSGSLQQVYLHAAREHDSTAPMQWAELPAGALRIADLGYFQLRVLAQLQQQGSYWLTRYKSGTRLYTTQAQPLALLDVLKAQTDNRYSATVLLGKRQPITCRLLAHRASPEKARQRRSALQAQASRKQQALSASAWQLAEWTILLTNVPSAQLNFNEAFTLAAYRWQIELLFKVWKQEGQIDTWRTQQPERILCEIYAKLLALLLLHWLTLSACWQQVDRSLFQASHVIRHFAWEMARHLPLHKRLTMTLYAWCRCVQTACRVGVSRRAPRAHQRLVQSFSLT